MNPRPQAQKYAVDSKETVGNVLVNLTIFYDCLNHDLLIAKLHTLSVTMVFNLFTVIQKNANNV